MSRKPIWTRCRPLAWTTIRFLLGVLLLTAAGLKLAGQGVSAVPQIGWFATPAVQIAAAEWELAQDCDR